MARFNVEPLSKLVMRETQPSNSNTRIDDSLRPVIRRRRIVTGGRYALAAMFISASGTVLALSVAMASGYPRPIWLCALSLVLLPTAAFVAGLLRRCTATDVAVEADRCYALQDRLLSAIEFDRISNGTPLHELQLQDAREFASRIDPRQVVPWQMPPYGKLGIVAACIAVGLAFVPRNASTPLTEPALRPSAIARESQHLAEQAEKVAEMAEAEQDPALMEIAARMRESASTVGEAPPEVAAVLEEFSQLQETIRKQQAEYDVEHVQARLQTLAEVMQKVAGLEQTALALEQLDFETAAESLEGFDPSRLDTEAAELAAESLQEAADELDQAALDALADPLREMSEGLRDENPAQASSAAEELAAQLRKHGKRVQANSQLQNQLTSMTESKARLTNGQSFDLPGQDPQRPSSEVGTGIHGDLEGELSQLDAMREQVEIAGTLGEGASSVETSIAESEGDTAQRTYRQIYQQYEKQSQAVLESEPLPLGHQQTIRRYFQLIRPPDDAVSQ